MSSFILEKTEEHQPSSVLLSRVFGVVELDVDGGARKSPFRWRVLRVGALLEPSENLTEGRSSFDERTASWNLIAVVNSSVSAKRSAVWSCASASSNRSA
ncbi:hypothetical protein OM076_09050 [Solirubrobacter ginsenosidimutans]|uniref:Uncharacterized protein n=1 Tax=Solirubrobacter ginsenosidimutans TaxID=490573 RepID=A0A9X3S1T1_9ACTN|nr:hypothetical protein [Solirubrobacter ginsenosidimutans]MDA0160411.1 hypothetical protein [Solirubrobacter ginsenosidimutans]